MSYLHSLVTPPCVLVHRWYPKMALKQSILRTNQLQQGILFKHLLCHPGSLCHMAIRTMQLKASFHFMRSRLLWQDPRIPQEAWFTIPSPRFYRAWLCKWNWWRPQPRVTESSDLIADLQCLPSHSVTLMSSQRAPGGDSPKLELSSITYTNTPTEKKMIFFLSGYFPLTQSSQYRNPCKDVMTASRDEFSGMRKFT